MSGFGFAVRVYYEDTDAGGVVYFANHLRFMERARTEWLRGLGFGQSELRERQGILFVVRSVAAEYHRPARLDDALLVESRLVAMSLVVLRFEQAIRRADETLVTGRSDVICVDAASLRPCRMPATLTAVLQGVVPDAANPGRILRSRTDRDTSPGPTLDDPP